MPVYPGQVPFKVCTECHCCMPSAKLFCPVCQEPTERQRRRWEKEDATADRIAELKAKHK